MNFTIQTTTFAAAALMLASISFAQSMLMADNGMTLYIFDKDKAEQPSCYNDCAVKWPPYVGTADQKMPDDWKLVSRTDGMMQWTYDGKPLYFFAGDKAMGDTTGDGLGGVWHIIKE